MEAEALTQNMQITNVATMENEQEVEPKRRKDGSELARPIMIYPKTPEQRKMFEDAAKLDNRKLSPFIVHVLTEHVRKQRKKTA
jgi:hypothetical protein